MDLFASDSILPPEPDLEVLHDREYRVRAYRKADDVLMLCGAVRDQKPPGLYIAVDPDPLTVHHMQIELDVDISSFEITRAAVVYESHPHDTCPVISVHYEQLVGLSIARGFTHRVRELFGGPRGCTHVTALIQAMAPVAIQSTWSLRASAARRAGSPGGLGGDPEYAEEQRRRALAMNVNTCHIWAEDAELVASLRSGATFEVPVFLRSRLDALGLGDETWTRGGG